jgi:hypothetical protein
MYMIKINDDYAINADQIQFVSYVVQTEKPLEGERNVLTQGGPTIRIKFAGEKEELLLSGKEAERLWRTLTELNR